MHITDYLMLKIGYLWNVVQWSICHGPLSSDLHLLCKVKMFIRGRFEDSFYCSNMKFCIRAYIYKNTRNTEESVHIWSVFHDRLTSDLGWKMEDLRFYVLFNSTLVISGQWTGDNERLCAMEPHLQLRRFRLNWGSHLGPLGWLCKVNILGFLLFPFVLYKYASVSLVICPTSASTFNKAPSY